MHKSGHKFAVLCMSESIPSMRVKTCKCPNMEFTNVRSRAGQYTGIKYFICTGIDIEQILLYRQTGIL